MTSPTPIVVAKSFKKALAKKPAPMQSAILECVRRLSEDRRHPGLRTHPIRGTAGVFEAYVDKANRVTFNYDQDGAIVLRNHCNHSVLSRRP